MGRLVLTRRCHGTVPLLLTRRGDGGESEREHVELDAVVEGCYHCK